MPNSLLILARALHFGSGMILVGVVAFRWLVLLPAFAGESDETWQKFTPFFRKLHFLFVGAGIVLIASGFLWFWAVSANMSSSSLTDSLSLDTLSTVFFQTQFGTVCQWRIGFAVVLAFAMGALAWKRWTLQRKRSWLEIAAGLLAAALVVSIAWTGHAAATGGADFWWRVLADATHLFAATIWPTGLLPFALFLGCARRLPDDAILLPTLSAAARFSSLSFLVVGVLIATGTINTYFIVGSFQALVTTDYGRLLCLKLFLLLLILGIAARNRYHLLPRLLSPASTPNHSPLIPLLSRLQGFVLTEFCVAVTIVVVTSVLGTTPPPR